MRLIGYILGVDLDPLHGEAGLLDGGSQCVLADLCAWFEGDRCATRSQIERETGNSAYALDRALDAEGSRASRNTFDEDHRGRTRDDLRR